MWYKKWTYRIILLIVVFLPALLYLSSKLWIQIDRSIFVYEYLFILLAISFNIRPFITWMFFMFFLFVDFTSVFSKLYLFNLIEFINAIKYFGNYNFNISQLVISMILLSTLVAFYFLFRVIKIKIGGDRLCLKLFLIVFVSIFALDNLNGSSILVPYNPSLSFYNSNFAGSPLILLTKSLENLIVNSDKPLLHPTVNESITFNQYVNDDSSNQMLIIVESFGLIQDSLKRKEFQKAISTIFGYKHWKTSWGQTRFTGSTTRSELRELLNCVGDYRYFIDAHKAQKIKSIFQIKRHQGYVTNAIHSYKANMFERVIWWKNIGVNNVYFSEDVQSINNYKKELNNDTPFISVNDEEAFDFIQAKSSASGKQFSYFLTENSHLPFKGKIKKSGIHHLFNIDSDTKLSEEAKNQSKRISNFLVYVANHFDSNKFQKLIIVGDHMPPFLKKEDRAFYSDQFVPYCIVTK
jgi:hypothetical protein